MPGCARCQSQGSSPGDSSDLACIPFSPARFFLESTSYLCCMLLWVVGRQSRIYAGHATSNVTTLRAEHPLPLGRRTSMHGHPCLSHVSTGSNSQDARVPLRGLPYQRVICYSCTSVTQPKNMKADTNVSLRFPPGLVLQRARKISCRYRLRRQPLRGHLRTLTAIVVILISVDLWNRRPGLWALLPRLCGTRRTRGVPKGGARGGAIAEEFCGDGGVGAGRPEAA